jgi:hypothetical protein
MRRHPAATSIVLDQRRNSGQRETIATRASARGRFCPRIASATEAELSTSRSDSGGMQLLISSKCPNNTTGTTPNSDAESTNHLDQRPSPLRLSIALSLTPESLAAQRPAQLTKTDRVAAPVKSAGLRLVSRRANILEPVDLMKRAISCSSSKSLSSVSAICART